MFGQPKGTVHGTSSDNTTVTYGCISAKWSIVATLLHSYQEGLLTTNLDWLERGSGSALCSLGQRELMRMHVQAADYVIHGVDVLASRNPAHGIMGTELHRRPLDEYKAGTSGAGWDDCLTSRVIT